jgi:hypothetical protein
MALGRKTGGRQKGSLNRLTIGAKTAFQLAFDDIGGHSALAEWATENRGQFYQLFSKLIPAEVVGPGAEGQHKIEMVLSFR